MVMAGYRGKPELTAAAFDDDGWLRTGDIFTTDEAGYYRIVDRKKEIIVTSAGKNVSPVHVENTIAAASPLVGSVVCIGDDRPYCTALDRPGARGHRRADREPDPAANARHPAVVAALTDRGAPGQREPQRRRADPPLRHRRPRPGSRAATSSPRR